MREETAKTSIGPMLPFLCVMHGETQGPAVRGANMPTYTEELRTFPHQGAPARGKVTQPCRCVRPRQQQELLRSGPMAQNEKRLVKKRNEVYNTIVLGIHGRHFKTMSVCTRKSKIFGGHTQNPAQQFGMAGTRQPLLTIQRDREMLDAQLPCNLPACLSHRLQSKRLVALIAF